MIICPWKDLGRYADVIPGLEEAIKVANSVTSFEKASYPCGEGNKVNATTTKTKAAEGRELEAHRAYLDIQYIVKGSEVLGWAPIEKLTPTCEYNEEKDYCLYKGDCDYFEIREGYCYVVFPEDAHLPAAHLTEERDVQKLIIKLKV